MDRSRSIRKFVGLAKQTRGLSSAAKRPPSWTCWQCTFRNAQSLRQLPPAQRRWKSNPADEPGFQSIIDQAPVLIRSGRRHNKWGLLLLATIPVTAFVLGCWQVQRLGWKTDLIAKFEDRLIRDPLPLPPQVDPDAVVDFDFRRVYARGRWLHEKEMLIGPRLHDGDDGYLVITPLERSDFFPAFEGNTTILVCRGWIPKGKAAHRTRPEGLPRGVVVVEGLLRVPWKKNSFTPDNKPNENKCVFSGHQGNGAACRQPADLD